MVLYEIFQGRKMWKKEKRELCLIIILPCTASQAIWLYRALPFHLSWVCYNTMLIHRLYAGLLFPFLLFRSVQLFLSFPLTACQFFCRFALSALKVEWIKDTNSKTATSILAAIIVARTTATIVARRTAATILAAIIVARTTATIVARRTAATILAAIIVARTTA